MAKYNLCEGTSLIVTSKSSRVTAILNKIILL